MPEDQGINGDIWNKEATELLIKSGWTKIADREIDIKGIDNSLHGIDSLLKYENPPKPNIEQGVILEAKRYKTTSFQNSFLDKWVHNLDKKIQNLKYSQTFCESYPEMADTDLRNGVLMIWFSDLDNYKQELIQNSLNSFKISGFRGNTKPNRIFVMDNSNILRICSIFQSINSWESNNPEFRIRFYYPTSDKLLNPIQRSSIINLEYMYSKFILAEATNEKGIEHKIVFYFGDLKLQSFFTLKAALSKFGFIDKEKSLSIFHYERNDEFRKVAPDVYRHFDGIEFKLLSMNTLADLPPWIKDL